MKFQFRKAALAELVRHCRTVVSERSTIPACKCVLIEVDGSNIVLSATNTRDEVQVTGELVSSGELIRGDNVTKVLVNAKDLAARLDVFGDEILDCSTHGTSFTLRASKRVHTLPTVDVADMPKMHLEIDCAKLTATLEASVIIDGVSSTKHCAYDSSRANMYGVWLTLETGKATVFATDSKVMAIRTYSTEYSGPPIRVLLPYDSLTLVDRSMPDPKEKVDIHSDGARLWLKTTACTTVIQLPAVEGYPQYEYMLPQLLAGETVAVVNREELLAAFRSVDAVPSSTDVARVEVEPGHVQLTPAFGAEQSTDVVDAECTTPGKFGIAAEHAIHSLTSLTGERVRMNYSSSIQDPILFREVGHDNSIHIIMPCILPEEQ